MSPQTTLKRQDFKYKSDLFVNFCRSAGYFKQLIVFLYQNWIKVKKERKKEKRERKKNRKREGGRGEGWKEGRKEKWKGYKISENEKSLIW